MDRLIPKLENAIEQHIAQYRTSYSPDERMTVAEHAALLVTLHALDELRRALDASVLGTDLVFVTPYTTVEIQEAVATGEWLACEFGPPCNVNPEASPARGE